MRAVLLHHLYPEPAARAAAIERVAAACRADDAVPVIRDRGALTVVRARPAATRRQKGRGA